MEDVDKYSQVWIHLHISSQEVQVLEIERLLELQEQKDRQGQEENAFYKYGKIVRLEKFAYIFFR